MRSTGSRRTHDLVDPLQLGSVLLIDAPELIFAWPIADVLVEGAVNLSLGHQEGTLLVGNQWW